MNEFQQVDDMGRWTLTDTLGDYLDGESRQEQRLDEEARDLRWQAFMDWAREGDVALLLERVAWIMSKRACAYGELADFVEQEGWSGVLYALAQIQQEREKAA